MTADDRRMATIERSVMANALTLGFPGGWEWIIVLVVALLIFGRRLPDVGRSIGRGLVEFKKGLKGVKDELDEVDRDVHSAGEACDEDDASEPQQLESDRPGSTSSTTTSAHDKANTS